MTTGISDKRTGTDVLIGCDNDLQQIKKENKTLEENKSLVNISILLK